MSRLSVQMPARARSRSRPSTDTRERIVAAVRDLLAEGTFHDSTVENVAERAGVSRATLYQHFRSRLELVDAICDVMALNPALVELRERVDLPDPELALAETISHAVRFWSSEDRILSQLYGVVAVDPAAKAFVERQRADRRGELLRLARNLKTSGHLRAELTEKRALAVLLLLTSYESYRELQEAGLSERDAIKLLEESGRTLLLATAGASRSGR
jgi:AcrR family transcriptional regulator